MVCVALEHVRLGIISLHQNGYLLSKKNYAPNFYFVSYNGVSILTRMAEWLRRWT